MSIKIIYHYLKAKIFLFFVCLGCVFTAYSSGYQDLPDSIHTSKAVDIVYYDDISFCRESIVDSIENPKAYLFNHGDSQMYIALERESKYAVFSLSKSPIKSHTLERKNINKIGNDELIIHWDDLSPGMSGGTASSGILVWDIDSYNCFLDFQNWFFADYWYRRYGLEETDEATFSSYYEESCYGYTVELEEMQMTIQLTQDSYDNKCIDVNGKKYFYKLTGSGFVLDRKEDAELGNKENPLFGKTYRKITDIPELKNWTTLGGGVIYPKELENYDFKFGISNYKDENGDIIFIFQEFIGHDEKGRTPESKILDTLNIGKLGNNEFAWYQQCRKDNIFDSEIIAIVFAEKCKKYEDKIVKAWRANTQTGKIQAFERIYGIDCVREDDCEDYGGLEEK